MGDAPPQSERPAGPAGESAEPAPARIWLPSLLREMADAFGQETARAFAERFGGRYVYMPAKAKPTHPVAQAFGLDVLKWLMGRHDRLKRVVVPMWPGRDIGLVPRTIQRLLADGKSTNEIAGEVGLHVRTVELWRRRLRGD